MTTTRIVFLATKQLDLVQLTTADAMIGVHWINDHTITQFLARGRLPISEAGVAKYYEATLDQTESIVLGIWHRADARLIGTIGLHDISAVNQSAELGIVIGETNYHDQGHGQAAIKALCDHGFRRLNLRHITLRVFGNNPRGERCYTKLGFRRVGCYPAHAYTEGCWHDEVHMLLTHEQFERAVNENEAAMRIRHIVQQSQ